MVVDIKNGTPSKTVSVLWQSLDEPQQAVDSMQDAAAKATAATYLDGSYIAGRGGKDYARNWFGAETAVALERLQKGWAEGVDRLMALPCRDFEATDVRRRRTRADQGDEVDMQAVWRGDLSRAWTRTRRQSRMGFPTVSIVCNVGAHCGTDANTLFWRGAAVLRLTAALAEAGHNVGIYAAVATRGVDQSGRVNVGQVVEVKAPDYPLDLSHLAALTAMPVYFRTALFAGMAWACDKVGTVADSSLGTPMHDLAPFCAAVGIENVVLQGEVKDQRSAEAWIESAIKQVEARSE